MSAEEVCRQVYTDTQTFYNAKREALGQHALGFRILYGPPISQPPIFFVGYQPGGRALEDEHHAAWPPVNDYAVQKWPLAARLQDLFGRDLLERCTGANSIFFRAPSDEAWRQIDRSMRSDLERFSLAQLAKIVAALRPGLIVVIGLKPFDKLTDGAGVAAVSSNGRVLLKTGSLWGIPASGVVHLSGARISTTDRMLIRDHFAPT